VSFYAFQREVRRSRHRYPLPSWIKTPARPESSHGEDSYTDKYKIKEFPRREKPKRTVQSPEYPPWGSLIHNRIPKEKDKKEAKRKKQEGAKIRLNSKEQQKNKTRKKSPSYPEKSNATIHKRQRGIKTGKKPRPEDLPEEGFRITTKAEQGR